MSIGKVANWNCIILALLFAATTNAGNDGDGVADNIDNCLNISNPDQRDTDADGIGNACDADLNDDCIVNVVDLGIFRSVFFTSDADADFNGDGVVNVADLGTFRLLFFAPPGPTGSQNLCSCLPPAQVPQADPNFEFGGAEVFLIGSLAGDGAAVSGLNNFSDQTGGVFLARIFARMAGTFDYRVADPSGAVDYCSDNLLSAYAPLELPAAGCAAPAGSVDIAGSGCYEFALKTDASLLPASVELTLGERLGRWDIGIDAGGGTFTAPNGVTLDVPPGAVTGPVTLTVGDVACEQVDALFGATTINSHSNRCLGGFVGEPSDLVLNMPIAVSVPAAQRNTEEIVLWLESTPGRQDYKLIDTALTYRGDVGTVEATIDKLAIFAVAAATPVTNAPFRAAAGLDPCCTEKNGEPPDPLCCCTSFQVQSTMGDSFSTDCDCQLVGFELEIEFPNCPGSPVFFDQESHSTENCPTDFQANLFAFDDTLWKCENRDITATLTGTNNDGNACSMPFPISWNVADPAKASIQATGFNTATITGIEGGVTSVNANSDVGDEFSLAAPITIVDIDGVWDVTETGDQTCIVNGVPIEISDSENGLVEVFARNCSEIEIDVGFPSLDEFTGAIATSGDPNFPFDISFDAVNSSNTLGCTIFFLENAMDIDFGEPFCPSEATSCQALSCNDNIMTNGVINPAFSATGAAQSEWTFDVSWSQTINNKTTIENASCSGDSVLVYVKQ